MPTIDNVLAATEALRRPESRVAPGESEHTPACITLKEVGSNLVVNNSVVLAIIPPWEAAEAAAMALL